MAPRPARRRLHGHAALASPAPPSPRRRVGRAPCSAAPPRPSAAGAVVVPGSCAPGAPRPSRARRAGRRRPPAGTAGPRGRHPPATSRPAAGRSRRSRPRRRPAPTPTGRRRRRAPPRRRRHHQDQRRDEQRGHAADGCSRSACRSDAAGRPRVPRASVAVAVQAGDHAAARLGDRERRGAGPGTSARWRVTSAQSATRSSSERGLGLGRQLLVRGRRQSHRQRRHAGDAGERLPIGSL